MHDPRENGFVVVIGASGGEPAVATAGAVSEIASVSLFYCGAGGLGALVTNSAFTGAVEANDPVAVVFSSAEEAFELRGRVSKFSRTAAIETLQRPSRA